MSTGCRQLVRLATIAAVSSVYLGFGTAASAAIATRLTISGPAAVTKGDPAVITGRLTRTDTGAGIPSQTIHVQVRIHAGTVWSTFDTTSTSATGFYQASYSPGVD